MSSTANSLISILRSEVCGATVDNSAIKTITDEQVMDLCTLAKKHDLVHIISHALIKHGSISSPDLRKKLEKQAFLAVYRCEQMNHELNEISCVFEKAEIPFIPLKGSVIRQYYPEPWMRTSCDIDILVHPEDWEKATELLISNCQYEKGYTNAHDVSMKAPSGVCVELHHTLVEEDIANNSAEVLAEAWKYATVSDNNKYCYLLTNEMLYLYHIAHMAKHFENGGCGIKPFLDLWVLENKTTLDTNITSQLLNQANLTKFAKMSTNLYKKWFEKCNYNDELLLQMEEFIINGGAFGNSESRVNMKQARQKSGLKYAISRVFLPYETLKYHYPILQKHPILTPFCQVRRWFKLLFFGGFKRSVNELRINSEISKEQAEKNKMFLNDIGL